MGQQVNRSSKVKSLSESDYLVSKWVKLLLLDPKPGDLSKTRFKQIERVNVA
ncbi:hypothetical protein M404DRAFT_1009397 [Pisolithus tinctorius Marx 270]|uniref:Uncharacterized protein n=1 Tax=Pisolithus tinctorius Marx 270 TaxID=870435 RepID=A0A0C3J4W2_PISTI|nr:hypothetical protein M404DRAFT_1009397 [Pisolithus tinctorius Marx 270]